VPPGFNPEIFGICSGDLLGLLLVSSGGFPALDWIIDILVAVLVIKSRLRPTVKKGFVRHCNDCELT
jgi:hypothetical protein